MPDPRAAQLRSEILNLFQYVQRLREEITAIASGDQAPSPFSGMAAQLGAIVDATESATETILQAMERVGEMAAQLPAAEDAAERRTLSAGIASEATQVMEACSFHDIAGQRISKVMGSLQFVEEHVSAMVDLWGREEIEDMAGKTGARQPNGADGVALEGPQLPGQAISQAEIDALFD